MVYVVVGVVVGVILVIVGCLVGQWIQWHEDMPHRNAEQERENTEAWCRWTRGLVDRRGRFKRRMDECYRAFRRRGK